MGMHLPRDFTASRRTQCPLLSLSAPSILKRAPRERPGHVAFDGITVYYFPRCQGFTSVPSRGGCTLGMASRHSACRRFSLAEFTQEQVRSRHEKLRRRLKEEKLETLRWKVRRPRTLVSTLQVQRGRRVPAWWEGSPGTHHHHCINLGS